MKRYFGLLICAAAVLGCQQAEKETYGSLIEMESAWDQSIWISAADTPVVTGMVEDGTRAADGANWFLSTVTNDKAVEKAEWMTTGLGVYEIYVNGKTIGAEILKPGFTHRSKTKRAFAYDVTEALNTKANAENVFAAQVTPGWWADKIITEAGSEGMFGKKCAFRAILKLTYVDGTEQILGTNLEDWKAGIAGPVKHADIFDGEEYDARVPQGWDTPEKLSTPEENTEFQGEILPDNGAEVYLRRDIALKPVKAYTWSGVTGNTDDEYGTINITKEYKAGEPMTIKAGETLVVDFGQNCAAVPEFEFMGGEGTTLRCLPGELLNDGNGAKSRGMDGPEGSVHRLNLRIPETGMILDYTFNGGAKFATYRPHFTFFGYRYVSITTSDDVTIKSIKSIPVSSITKEMEIGTITTGNEDINKLISNTLWGQRSNYLSVPTDCPQRNERLGWTADTQVFTETGTFFANTDRFFHKWMCDMRDTQSPLGGLPGVAPLAQYGAAETNMMRVGWADAGVIVPWTIYKQFGDVEIINENWDMMEKYMDHVAATKYDHMALIKENEGFQYGDWLSYEALESCSGKWSENLPLTITYWNFLSASYWAIDARMMCDMAVASGRDTAKWNSMLDESLEYIKTKFFNKQGEFKEEILNTMQTPALFALKNGVVEGKARETLIARLRQNFADHDNCLQTGFLGTSILMQTLTDNGMVDIAYELLLQRKNPSWLYSVDNGATTIWERWNSYMVDEGMGPQGMNSFNHYAYGCVCQWLWETAAGINTTVTGAGFKRIILKPIPDKRLGSLKAEYNSAAGKIVSEWRYEGDTFCWDLTIPEGCLADVVIPGDGEVLECGAGTHHYRR